MRSSGLASHHHGDVDYSLRTRRNRACQELPAGGGCPDFAEYLSVNTYMYLASRWSRGDTIVGELRARLRETRAGTLAIYQEEINHMELYVANYQFVPNITLSRTV